MAPSDLELLLLTHRSQCSVVTQEPPGFIDITPDVGDAVARSGVDAGLVTVSVPPQCALVVNEFESGLIEDLKKTVLDLRARSNGAAAHIGSTSVVLPLDSGRLLLGRWQRLLLVELEAAAERSVAVQVVGE